MPKITNGIKINGPQKSDVKGIITRQGANAPIVRK